MFSRKNRYILGLMRCLVVVIIALITPDISQCWIIQRIIIETCSYIGTNRAFVWKSERRFPIHIQLKLWYQIFYNNNIFLIIKKIIYQGKSHSKALTLKITLICIFI